MISYNLRDKAAIVTGATSGVGFAAAKMLVESGAAVALNFLPDDERARKQLQVCGRWAM